MAMVLTDCFTVGGEAPAGTLVVWAGPLSLATVVVVPGASVLDVPLAGLIVPGEGLLAVEGGMTVLDLLRIAADGVIAEAVVRTVAVVGVTLTGIGVFCDWLETVATIVVVVPVLALVVMSL